MLSKPLCAAISGVALYLIIRRERQRRHAHKEAGWPRAKLPVSPFALLQAWMDDAEQQAGFVEARTMVLATCSADDGPTARTIICHSADAATGLAFGSNPFSLKGRQLAADKRAEVVFRWGQRQCRVRGSVARETDSTSFFRTLPRGAQLGLQFLQQGKAIQEDEHAASLARYAALAAADDQGALPAPANYAAYRLEPVSFEFYMGGHEGYVNDRFLYLPEGKMGEWSIGRLQG